MRILCLVRLLEDPQVVEEIERYKWIESERRGFDIGEKAATMEWIRAYGCHWLKAHKRDKYQAMLQELCDEEEASRVRAQDGALPDMTAPGAIPGFLMAE